MRNTINITDDNNDNGDDDNNNNNNNYYKYFQSCNGLTELTFVFFFSYLPTIVLQEGLNNYKVKSC